MWGKCYVKLATKIYNVIVTMCSLDLQASIQVIQNPHIISGRFQGRYAAEGKLRIIRAGQEITPLGPGQEISAPASTDVLPYLPDKVRRHSTHSYVTKAKSIKAAAVGILSSVGKSEGDRSSDQTSEGEEQRGETDTGRKSGDGEGMVILHRYIRMINRIYHYFEGLTYCLY